MSNVTQRDPHKGINWRFIVFIAILLCMFGYLASGLVELQLMNSEEYKEKAQTVREKKIVLRGKRGNITDADSVILAKDELVHNITFYKDGSTTSKADYYEYTQSIVETIEIIERNGGQLAFDYVIKRDEETGEWVFNFGSGVSVPEVQILIKDFMHAPDTSSIRNQLNSAWRAGALEKTGANEEILSIALSSVPVYEQALGSMDLTGYTFGIVASMLMFFAVYFYGISVANSVAMEKTSRVMETLVISAKPSAILLGKCAAMGVAGLAQMTGIILYGVIMYNALVPEGTMILGMQLSFSGVTPVNLVIIILYFLFGYALFALLYAVCGATVSRIEDISPALMPVSMVSMISFYIGYFTSIMGNSSGAIEWVARYVPFCAPFGMPFRLLNGSVTVGQCVISLFVMLFAIALVSGLSIKLYKASIMHYGNRLKIKDLIKR